MDSRIVAGGPQKPENKEAGGGIPGRPAVKPFWEDGKGIPTKWRIALKRSWDSPDNGGICLTRQGDLQPSLKQRMLA